MKIESISCLSEYLAVIERILSLNPSGSLVNNPVLTNFLYRGNCDQNFTLLPTVFRKQSIAFDDQTIENYAYLSWTNEKMLLQSFIHEASGIVSISPYELGHWAEYAQHFGVPTRFLDWTSNPLTALYFACRDKVEHDGAVWLLNGAKYRRFSSSTTVSCNKQIREIINDLLNGLSTIENPILYTPYYVDNRMSAQNSYFLVWGTKTEPLEKILTEDSIRLCLPDVLNNQALNGSEYENAALFRFLIHADRKQQLLHELDIVGINEKTLFPGLDGIGRYIERKFRFDYYEALSSM